MKTEEQNYCCFCLSSSKGTLVNSEILELLKFITVHMNITALENSMVCDDCQSKILAIHNYKARNSSKMLMETNIEIDSNKFVICQMCEKQFEQEKTVPLVECVIQIDWFDFVNYLFTNQDIKSLKNYRLCESCHVSVSNIQDFLKLLHIYDRSKMKQDYDNYDDSDVKNEYLMEEKIKVKQECEDLINVKLEMTGNLNEDDDLINYEDFKCKIEEVDLKMEYVNNDDNDQLTHLYNKEDVKEIASSDESHKNRLNKEEENRLKSQEINCFIKVSSEIKDCQIYNTQKNMNSKKSKRATKLYNCTYCSKEFNEKLNLKNHLIKIHNSDVTSKIYECNKCSYRTIRQIELLQHNMKHGIKDNSRLFKCQQCSYETYKKSDFSVHMKMHNNIRDFKCSLCSSEFKRKVSLDNHLLKVHEHRDNVTSKLYQCNNCSYATTVKIQMLQHNIKHGIKDNFQIFKCQQCSYETYKMSHFSAHMKVHSNIRDFQCSLCTKNFKRKVTLDNHLLKTHKTRDNVTSKMYECDSCSYVTIVRKEMLDHNVKHENGKL